MSRPHATPIRPVGAGRPRARDCERERGAALILAILFVLALSAVGSAMAVMSRTETLSSVNYRMMSQSRYAAESGVHKAINYLLNAYVAPGGAGDPLANYDTTVSPVTYNGQPVVLSASAAGANYPNAAVRAAFSAAGQGTLAAGDTSVTFRSTATLLSMRAIQPYGGTSTAVVQTWRVDGIGGIAGVNNAEVEVQAIIEQQVVAAHTYAAFATNPGCGALSFSGGVITDSYDSTNITWTGGHPAWDLNGSDVGTNGNLTESGGSHIYGSLSTPRSGVGNCKSGAVDALTQSGGATLEGGLIQLPQALNFPTPALPNPLPPTSSASINPSTSCAGIGLTAAQCSGSSGNFTFNASAGPLSLGNLSVSGGRVIHLGAGTYNFNSISLSGGSSVVIDSGPVIMNVVGTGQTNPIDLSGGTTTNMTFDPSLLQILYAGTGGVRLSGGTAMAAMVYAPRAAASLSGGANFYGSVLAATVNDSGGVRIHYDRHLGQEFFTAGNYMLNSFTWKKY